MFRFTPWKYRSTCKLCSAIDHGKQFHDYFITTPTCLFCGSTEHKLVSSQIDSSLDDNPITTKYSCPYLSYEEWPDLRAQMNNGYLKVQSCPMKFATTNGYQSSEVNKAIQQLATSTYGFIMGRRGLSEFYDEVLKLCEKEQQSFTFKRTNMTTDESLDELEFSDQPSEL
jgi:hypothetical protein